jgi:hypothetical protein
MKVNFDTVLTQLDGETAIPYADGPNVRGMTLRDAAINALFSTSNSQPDGEAKFKVYLLCQRINAEGDVDVTPDEATQIKAAIGQAWGANIVGPAYNILNG